MRRSRLGAARWTFVTLGVALLLAAPPPPLLRMYRHCGSQWRPAGATSSTDCWTRSFHAPVCPAGLAVRYVPSLNALRDFCRNAPDSSPDMVLTTHPLHGALASECHQNRVYDVASVELARNALVLAVRSGSTLTRLTSRQVYRAVAREVAYRDEFVRNTATRWADVDPSLPVQDIRFSCRCARRAAAPRSMRWCCKAAAATNRR
ncbi:MAG: substrate-binding domain-containing protein [Acetobacteraceae bacterium]